MADRERTLITGAGGFIGGRVVEAMMELGDRDVVPGLRRWSTAARIGRYPVVPIQCDLMKPDQLADALEGVDSVIHCAVGNAEVTVEGTRNLLDAARTAGVRRVVHISTIDVYGRAEGTVDESHAYVETGREYGDSKIEAERVCREFSESGLEVVMLRPTIVYGPFSDLWTVEPAQRLVTGSWLLPASACQGTCNLVYVDDLVRAILLALDAPGVSGAAFNINGSDEVTWQDYVEALNDALGLPPLAPPPPASAKARTALVDPVRAAIKKAFFQFEEPIMQVYQRSRVARRFMKWVQSTLQKVPSGAEYELYSRQVRFPADRARAELGYRALVSMNEGVTRSAEWLVHEGVVPPRA